MDYKKLFELFCGTDEMRPVFLKPFKQKGYYVATDAHSAIYLPANPIIDADEYFAQYQEYGSGVNAVGVLPKLPDEPPAIINVAELERLLEPDLIPAITGCANCGGEGVLICAHCNSEYECDSCDGRGNIPEEPERLIPDLKQAFQINRTVYLSKQVIRLIEAAKLIGAETITQVYQSNPGKNLFIVGGFQILVMSAINQEKIKEITFVNANA